MQIKIRKPHLLVALTGTPGTGKTTVARLLRKRGFRVMDLNRLVSLHNAVFGVDAERCSNIADIKKLTEIVREIVKKKSKSPSKRFVFAEGHLAHLIKPDIVIILRCSPMVLWHRLKQKGYPAKKIFENAEAEAIDVITIESAELCSRVYEIDTTDAKPYEVVRDILGLLNNNPALCKRCRIGNIDWSNEILEWY